MKIVYHGADLDGKCSAAIVLKALGKKDVELIPYNYGEFPFEKIEIGEKVVVVDCSLDFEKLFEYTTNIIWIDHHVTAIDKYDGLELKGLRRVGTAACELTWEYFMDDSEMPEVVKYLGDYDVWKFALGEPTKILQTGLRLYDTEPTSDNWDQWLDEDYSLFDEINDGKIALKYRDNYWKDIAKNSFFTTFEGYKCVACNASNVSSQLFDSVEGDYDIMIPFSFNGDEWKLSLYTTKDNIHIGNIATKYGGGGHKGAAGFSCKELPFRKE